jgi:hypothetical protein
MNTVSLKDVFCLNRYKIMCDCWQINPSDRPSFTGLRKEFESMLQEDNPYLDFSNLDNEKYYYLAPSFDSDSDENLDTHV